LYGIKNRLYFREEIGGEILPSKTPQVTSRPIRSSCHVAFGEKNIYGRRVLGDGVDGGLRGKNRKGMQPI
jgi:hypothetical protein